MQLQKQRPDRRESIFMLRVASLDKGGSHNDERYAEQTADTVEFFLFWISAMVIGNDNPRTVLLERLKPRTLCCSWVVKIQYVRGFEIGIID